ncbi:MAG: GMC family oxidoreductase [Anaerolineales bacterium]
MTVQNRVDVVTVGAGWTAAILAWKLTAAGLRVVSLEQGPVRATAPYFDHNHDHLSHSVRNAMMVNLGQETWTWRPNPAAPSLPVRKYGAFHPGQGLGGAGVHWAAQHWRFYPSDFRYRSHHVARYGAGKLPQGARVQDWGLTYEELEPYFDAVDYDIGVTGQAGNLRGEIQPGGNPFEGPRSRPYPLPPLERSLSAAMFSDACEELGHHPFRQPGAILSRAYTGLSGRVRAGCLYCGFCVRFGCEVDAKASAITDHIPLALETGLYEVRPHSYVTQVNTGSDGLATGVSYIDLTTGEEHEQPAAIVILSAYPLSNVRLLLLSRSSAHPDGIGNDRGRVGKNLTYQLITSPVTGIFEDRRLNFYMGNSVLQDVIHDFNADNFDHSDLDFIGGASITCGGGARDPLTSTLAMPSLRAGTGAEENGEDAPPPHPPLFNQVGSLAGGGEEWGAAWKENLRRNWDGVVPIVIQGESLPYDDQFMDLDPRYTDAFGRPLLRLTFDWHENDRNLYRFIAQRCREIMEAMGPDRMTVTEELGAFEIYPYQSTHITGGAIMGTDPERSVTNRYGQVWDTPNVFVTGATLYPQNAGMNPTGPLLALSYLAGDGIREKYLDDEGRLID